MFNVAIDSKLRGCDLVKLRVTDIHLGDSVRLRTTVMQQKTGRPVPFELTEPTRDALKAWLKKRGQRAGEWLFPHPVHGRAHRQSGLRLQLASGGAAFNNMYVDSRVEEQPEIDFVAHAASMGAYAEKAADVADLARRIAAARGRDKPTVIVIDTDAGLGRDGGGGFWWDVAVPEVGRSDRQTAARADYVAHVARQELVN